MPIERLLNPNRESIIRGHPEVQQTAVNAISTLVIWLPRCPQTHFLVFYDSFSGSINREVCSPIEACHEPSLFEKCANAK